MSGYVNSDSQLEKMKEVFNLLVPAEIITSNDVVSMVARSSTQMEWINNNRGEIDLYFNPSEPTSAPTNPPSTDAPTTIPPTTSPTTEPTTLGSSSVFASFFVIAVCGFVKMFV